VADLKSAIARGSTRNRAIQEVHRRHKIGTGTLIDCIKRGDVPGIPPTNAARAAAWKAGEFFYRGKACKTCGGERRLASTDCCADCL